MFSKFTIICLLAAATSALASETATYPNPPGVGIIDPGTRTPLADDETYLLCYYENWARYERYWTQIEGEEETDVLEQSLKSKESSGAYTLDPSICTHLMYGFLYINPETYEMEFSDAWSDIGYDTTNEIYWDENGVVDYFWKKSGIYNSLRFKQENSKLRFMASVGGWNFNNCEFNCFNQGVKTAAAFSEIAASEEKTRTFARSAKEFLTRWHFDGLDLDWEYPAVEGRNDCSSDQPTMQDRGNFITMIQRIKEEFAGTDLLVTAAVGVGKHTAETAYDIPAMAAELDLISLMTYDIHGAWEHVMSFNAPLYASEGDLTRECEVPGGGACYEDEAFTIEFPEITDQALCGKEGKHWNSKSICMGGNAEVSTAWAVDYWLDHGVPADKLVVGVPTYGRGFTMADEDCHTPSVCSKDYSLILEREDPDCAEEDAEPVSPGASHKARALGDPNVSGYEPGFMTYYEIAERLDSGDGWKQGRSEEHGQVPYIYHEQTRQWIGYDDTVSIVEKMNYIRSKQVRGAMVWALSLDDTRGDFHDTPFPLLNTIKEGLNYSVLTGETTTAPSFAPTYEPVIPDVCCPKECSSVGCAPQAVNINGVCCPNSAPCLSQSGHCMNPETHSCGAELGDTDCSACTDSAIPKCGDEPTNPPTNPPTDPPTNAPTVPVPEEQCPATIVSIAPCMPSTSGIAEAGRVHGAELTLDCPHGYKGAIDYECSKESWIIVGGSCHEDCSLFQKKKTCKLAGECKWKKYFSVAKKAQCYDKNFKPAMPDCNFDSEKACAKSYNGKNVCEWDEATGCVVKDPKLYQIIES